MQHAPHESRPDPTSPMEGDSPFISFEGGQLSAQSLRLIEKRVNIVARCLAPNGRYQFDADDVAQSAKMKVLAAIGGLHVTSKVQFRVWLQRVTTNTFHDLQRLHATATEKETGEDKLAQIPAAGSFGDHKLVYRTIAATQLVTQLMEDLTEKEKSLVWSRLAEENTIEKVAEMFGMTVAGVKYALTKAINKMIRKSLRRK